MSEEKGKRRLRFTFEDDVILLREVVSRNPFANAEAWEEIQRTVFALTKKQFILKSIKQHIHLLLELWELKEQNNEKSSGIEEPYSEKDVLLQEVKELVEAQKNEKIKKQKNKVVENTKTDLGKTFRNEVAISFFENSASVFTDHDYNDNIIIEDCTVPSQDPEISDNNVSVMTENENEAPKMTALETFGSELKSGAEIASKKNCKNILGPIRTRAKRTTYMRRSGLEYLKDKHQKDLEIEGKRLDLEEKKIAVSERTIALAEKKFLFETEHYKNMFESQQKIINDLLDIIRDLKRNCCKS